MSNRAKKFVVKFDADLTVQENWDRAIPLHEAWLIFLDDDALHEQYRKSKTQGATQFAEALIKQSVLDHLYAGELIALGVLVPGRPTSAAPDAIPQNMFRMGVGQLDWNNGTIEGLGRVYHAVHVCLADGQSLAPVEKLAPAKRGRKSLDPQLIEAARSLLLDPAFEGMLQEKQVNELQRRAAELHPAIFPNNTQPGRSTVYRFVARHRASHWRDCRDPENPE